MARETLPSGASLLALAGSSVARPPAPARESVPEPSKRVADRQIGPNPRLAPNAPPEQELRSRQTYIVSALVPRKQKVNARISAALLDEVRDCVVALSGPPHGFTMDAFAEEAYRRELERLRCSHNDGRPFAKRPYNPRPGRRVA
jgi:hypothetical protein